MPAATSVDNASPEPATWQWVVNVGPDVGVDQASVFLARMRGEKLMTSQLLETDQFPDRWFGYEGVDVLLVTTGEESPVERLGDEQYAALLRWLQLGGRLVYSAGQARAGSVSRGQSVLRACGRASWTNSIGTGRLRGWRTSRGPRSG